MINIGDALKVIMKASDIPDGSTVTKIKGTNEYYMQHNLKVYLVDGKQEIIKGCFLLGERAAINQVYDDLELVWHTTVKNIYNMAQRYYDESDSK